jgi:hypothetical protein
MPTPLTKPIARLLLGPNLIITLTEEGVYVREPRKRKRFGPISYAALQYYALQIGEA